MSSLYVQALERSSRLWPAKPAVWADGHTHTFAELHGHAVNLARWLRGPVGLNDGDRVVDVHFNSYQSYVADFGLAVGALVRVALNPVNTAHELRRQILLTQPRVILTDARCASQIGEEWLAEHEVLLVLDSEMIRAASGEDVHIRPAPHNGDAIQFTEPVLSLRFTGGSTGEPKAVLRTVNQQCWVAASMLADLISFRADDSILHTQSLSVGAQMFVLPAIMRGALQVVTSQFDVEQSWSLVKELQITRLKCVPTTLRRFVEEADRGPVPETLRTVLYGASPAEKELVHRALEAFGPGVRMAQTYGQTEAPAVMTLLSEDDHELARAGRTDILSSVGRPYSFTDIMVLDDAGEPCSPGQSGEIAVRAPFVANQRWLDGKLVPLRLDSQVHRTGDMGHFEDGNLFIDGRRNEMLISGGYNVYPLEVERTLLAHPLVEQACVVGLEDLEWGDRVVAVVVLKTDSDPVSAPSAIRDYCKERLARYKVPKEILVTHDLPLTAAGKVSRPGVKQMVVAEQALTARPTEKAIPQ